VQGCGVVQGTSIGVRREFKYKIYNNNFKIRRVTGLNFVETVEVILWLEHRNEFTRSAVLLVYKFVK